MKNSQKGQVSFEFLLVILVAIIIFSTAILPLVSISLDYSNDMNDIAKTKVELSKIASNFDDVISSGIGSKRTVNINIPTDCYLELKNNPTSSGSSNGELIAKVYLSTGEEKIIRINTKSNENLNNHMIFLNKGEQVLSISWELSNNQITLKKL
ncbi:MAG: hypothetical protein ACRCVG_05810 [Methanobacteriaceae archaeon]